MPVATLVLVSAFFARLRILPWGTDAKTNIVLGEKLCVIIPYRIAQTACTEFLGGVVHRL
jgi:hypothetical protein